MGNILSSILSSFYLHLAINSYNIGISQNHIFMRSVGSWPRFPNPLTSARKEEAASETQDMGPALAFRFGYKDWFDFSFRLGSRKSSHKPTAREVLIHTGYNVRAHGSLGRRVELQGDIMEPMLPRKSQEQSILFKALPAEIRRMIWGYLLVSAEHIATPSRLLSSKMTLLASDYHPIPGLDARILRTCRAIYNEAIPILYGQNTFYFTSTHTLFDFLGDDLPKALPTGDAYFQTGSVFNFRVTPAGRLALVRQLVLRLTTTDSARHHFNMPSNPIHPQRPPHRSTLLYDWSRLLTPEGRMPGMFGEAVAFPSLENLYLDFSDWVLGPDEGLMTKPFVKRFSESGLLDKLTVKGIQHQRTLDELRSGLVKPNGLFISE